MASGPAGHQNTRASSVRRARATPAGTPAASWGQMGCPRHRAPRLAPSHPHPGRTPASSPARTAAHTCACAGARPLRVRAGQPARRATHGASTRAEGARRARGGRRPRRAGAARRARAPLRPGRGARRQRSRREARRLPRASSCLGAVTAPLIDLIISPPQGEVRPRRGPGRLAGGGRAQPAAAAAPGAPPTNAGGGPLSTHRASPARTRHRGLGPRALGAPRPRRSPGARGRPVPHLPPRAAAPTRLEPRTRRLGGPRPGSPAGPVLPPKPRSRRRRARRSSRRRGRIRSRSVCCVFLGFVFLPKNYPLCLCPKEARGTFARGARRRRDAPFLGAASVPFLASPDIFLT